MLGIDQVSISFLKIRKTLHLHVIRTVYAIVANYRSQIKCICIDQTPHVTLIYDFNIDIDVGKRGRC